MPEKNFLESKIEPFIEKAVCAFPDDEVSKLTSKFSDVCVVDEKKNFLGLVLEGTLLVAGPKEKAKSLAFNPPTLSPQKAVKEALKVFLSSGLQAIPVVDKGKLLGVLKVSKLIPKLPLSSVSLSEVINKNPFTVGEATPVSDVREIMVKGRVGRVYVVDSEENLVGVITHGSFLKKPSFFKKDWRRAVDIMERSVISVSPKDSLEKAVLLISKNNLRAVAVVEGGKLVGFVEVGEIIKKVLELSEIFGKGVEIQITGVSDLENFEKAAINSEIYGQVKKIAEEIGPSKVKIVFKRGKNNWEVSLIAETEKRGKSTLKATGFDAIFAVAEVLRTFQRKVRNG